MFREMFFEEARDLLAGLQSGLARLAEATGDRALLDRTYRQAHSLKGAAAMVGYPDIAEAARSLEQALTQVRSGKASLTADLVQTLAIDRDRLETMIDGEEKRLRGQRQ